MNHRIVIQLISFLVAAGVLYHRYLNSRDVKASYAFRRAPRVRLAQAVHGQVMKIVGRLERLGEPLTAPLTQRRCVHYELTIEEWHSSGRSGRWEMLVHDVQSRDFLVRDGGGAAVVRAGVAEVALHNDVEEVSGPLREPSPELVELLARSGHETTGTFGFNRKLRMREGVLEAGEHVAVCGAVKRWSGADNAAAGIPDDGSVQWLFEPQDEVPLYVSDKVDAIFKPKSKRRP